MFEVAATEIAREVDSALLTFIWLSVFMFVGIVGTMIWFLWEFRRSAAKTTQQIDGHLGLEITWTIVPTIIVCGLFFVGYKGFAMMRDVPDDVMVVKATGQQWIWSFEYPETGVTSAELYVPVNRAVKVDITAPVNDVLHSFYIPAFRIKEDAVPGLDTWLWFRADRMGTYNIFCAEFCGKDHSAMISKVHVLPQQEYDAWMDARVAEKYSPVDAVAAMSPDCDDLKKYDGAQLYGRYCASCHGGSGEGGGPYQSRDFRTTRGWKRSSKLTDVFTSISHGIDGTQMRAFGHLPVRARFAIMHHVSGFMTDGDRPRVTDADLTALKQAFPECDPENARPAPAQRPLVPLEDAMKQVVDEARAN